MSKENKQTAVDFLYKFVLLNLSHEQQVKYDGLFQQAKQMEKEQHDLTFARGSMTGYSNANGYESVDFEQYYDKTYGN
jgi:hypothetical protein